ncbi:MAG: Coenzyme F420 hydrogenase/dehydrogenase, beta subunit C-terminal domain [Promethearchaeota archaeon]
MSLTRYSITKPEFIQLLSYLLEKSYVSEVLSGVEKKNRYAIVPEFVSDPKKLENFPLSQLLTYGYTRTDSAANTLLHTKKALDISVAVVARACDIRAMVELEKKKQLKWENLFLIGFHDMGYLPNKLLRKWFKKEKIDESAILSEKLTETEFILHMKDGSLKKEKLSDSFNVAGNCTRCVEKSHSLADFLLSTYSVSEDAENYILTPQSDRARNVIKNLGWDSKAIDAALGEKYENIAQNIIDRCAAKREKDLDAFLADEDRFMLLTKCTGCGICVKSCAVCYCTVCNLTAQVKAKTMDPVMFITTRFTHVGDTCVECGRCATNCPMNIPLDLVFQSLRRKFQKDRGYAAGATRNQKVLHLDV